MFKKSFGKNNLVKTWMIFKLNLTVAYFFGDSVSSQRDCSSTFAAVMSVPPISSRVVRCSFG